MTILLDQKTPVIVQDFTGKIGTFHAQEMMDYGTNLVGGVTPGRGGGEHLGKPVFDSVKDAVRATDATASAVFELGGDWIDTIDATGRHRQTLDDDRAGLAAMVREFRRSVQQGRPPAMTGEEGARDVALVQACYESMRTNAPVFFPENREEE